MLKFLDGKKSYLAAAGLVGLAIFRLSAGDVFGGVQSLIEAAGLAGIRHAVSQGQPVTGQPVQGGDTAPKS